MSFGLGLSTQSNPCLEQPPQVTDFHAGELILSDSHPSPLPAVSYPNAVIAPSAHLLLLCLLYPYFSFSFLCTNFSLGILYKSLSKQLPLYF